VATDGLRRTLQCVALRKDQRLFLHEFIRVRKSDTRPLFRDYIPLQVTIL
jgi:hypothetical protein